MYNFINLTKIVYQRVTLIGYVEASDAA